MNDTPTPDYGESWKPLQPDLNCHRLRTWKTLHHTMNDTPTPETDGMTFFAQPGMMPPYNTVSSEFARKLERERDAALAANAELQDAVKRMEAIPVTELDWIWDNTGQTAFDGFEAVRARLIQAAKGEQP